MLGYVTGRSEKLRFVRKNGLAKNFFIWEGYAYFCDILIKIKLYAQNVQPKKSISMCDRVVIDPGELLVCKNIWVQILSLCRAVTWGGRGRRVSPGLLFDRAVQKNKHIYIKGFVQSTTAVSMRHCDVIFAKSFLQCHFCNVILIRRIILIFRFSQNHRHRPHSCPCRQQLETIHGKVVQDLGLASSPLLRYKTLSYLGMLMQEWYARLHM